MTLQDPAEYQAQTSAVQTYVNERDGWRRQISSEQGQLLSNVIRENPTVSPDLVAAFGAAGPQVVNQDTIPWMQDIVNRDAVVQDNWFSGKLKAASQIGFMGLESLWQASPASGLGRTILRAGQGESLPDAWRSSSANEMSRFIADSVHGKPTDLGSGWLPGGTPTQDRPEWDPAVRSGLEQGLTLADAAVQADESIYQQYGKPIQQQYNEVAESTLMHKTVDGETYASPFSIGRAFAIQVSTPNTIPFQAMSTMIDGAARVTIDPIDLPLNEFILYRSAKKGIVGPGQDAAIRQAEIDHLYTEGYARPMMDDIDGVTLQNADPDATLLGYVEPRRGAMDPDMIENMRSSDIFDDELDALWDDWHRDYEGAPRDVAIDYDAVEAEGARINALAEDDLLGVPHGSPDEIINPYTAGHARLDEIAQERHGMSYNEYIYQKYGDGAVQEMDNTLTHELVHAEYQYDGALMGRIEAKAQRYFDDGMDWGDAYAQAHDDLLARDGAFTNLHPDTKAMERFNRAMDQRRDLHQRRQATGEHMADQVEEITNAQRQLDEAKDGWGDLDTLNKTDRKAAEREIANKTKKRDALQEGYDANKASMDDINRQLDETKKWSPGRDATEYDAVVQTGLRLMADESSLKAVRNQALRDAGMTSAWRPWLKPQLMEDWLTSSKGQRIIKFLTSNESLAAQRKFLKGIPPKAQQRILNSTSEAQVIRELAPYLGRELGKVPNMGKAARISTKVDNGLGALAEHGFAGGIIANTRTGLHRMGSKMVTLKLDPNNIETTLDHTEAWLRTIRASDAEVDTMLNKVLDAHVGAGNEFTNYTAVYDELIEFYGTKLAAELGDAKYAEGIVKAQMEDFTRAILENQEYWVDAAGNKVDDLDDVFKTVWSQGTGGNVGIPKFSAVLESQTSMTQLVLPNGRQVRRATSGVHLRTQRLAEGFKAQFLTDGTKADQMFELLFPDGLNNSAFMNLADGTQTVWRDMALLRIGWPLRVLPEEMLRQAAAGYGDFITHPFSYMALMTRKAMMGDVMGGKMADVMTLDALGSGHFRADPLQWNATRQSWTPVHRGAKGYNEGFAREWLQLHNDEVARHLNRNGYEETLEWLQTPRGKAAAERATKNAQGSAKINLRTVEGQRQYLDRAAAMSSQMTGGEWIRRNAQGKWVDMFGQPVDDWYDMTKAQIVEKINVHRVRNGEETISALPASYTKDHWVALAEETTGVPAMKNVPSGQNYVVIRQGNAELIEQLGTGKLADDIMVTEDIPLVARDAFDSKDLADELIKQFDEREVLTPNVVRTPRDALSKPSAMYNSAIDTIFESLMAKPSSYLVRSPFFLQRYGDNMAKFYLFADPELRRVMKSWAADNNVTTMFNRQIRQQANRAGFSRVPPPAKTDEAFGARAFSESDMFELDQIAKSEGLQATKDLFYDLAERNNIADMTRHIFPFADAWYEVLSRWAKILLGSGGQSVKTWHRGQVGINNARKTGFFQEDEYGRETFNWPGAGLLAPWMVGNPEDTGLSATMGLDQLMFLDPKPRGFLMPGVGPMVQIPASMVQAKLDDMPVVRDAVNWFAFGDFADTAPQSTGELILEFFPSWVRQAGVVFMSDDRKQDIADEIGGVYETLLLSKDQGFGDETPDKMQKTFEQAQSTGTALSWLKLIERFVAPATPRYEAVVHDKNDFWVMAEGISGEFKAAREFFGNDADMAYEYVVGRFGLNPLQTYANTYRVTDAPSTKTAYDFLQTNQELYDVAPSTMMAWIDVPEDDDFFNVAYQKQKDVGSRVVLDLEQRAWAINEQKGWQEWNKVIEETDLLFAEIDQYTEERSLTRTAQRELVQQYKNKRKAAIYEDYWAWDNAGKREGSLLPERPSTETLWDDFMQAGTPGTEAYKFTSQLDPAMSEFMVAFTNRVKALREVSPTSEMNWWLTSSTDLAVAQRDGFIKWAQDALKRLPPESQLRGEYVMERYISPLFTDFDWDEGLWLIPEQLPNPDIPSWFDNMPSTDVLNDDDAAKGDVNG